MKQKKLIRRNSIIEMGRWCFAFTLDEMPDSEGMFNSWYKKIPLKWKVLRVENKKVFVICKQLICHRKFDNANRYNIWEDTELREWLNTVFIDRAFDEEEQKKILTTELTTELEREGEVVQTDETQDKIFIPTARDVWRNIPKNAIECGEPYWLRNRCDDFMSSYYPVYCLRYLNHYNKPDINEEVEPTESLGVRPAMWIDIKINQKDGEDN